MQFPQGPGSSMLSCNQEDVAHVTHPPSPLQSLTLTKLPQPPQSQTQSAEQTSKDDVHIRFNPIPDISGNVTVKFGEVYSSSMMSLAGENRDKIHVNCTGPYLLYMYLCYKDMGEKDARGTLQLLVAGADDPVSHFALRASHEVCRGLHSVAYLMDKDTVSLRLSSTKGFKIKTVTVGLSYLLGRCEFL